MLRAVGVFLLLFCAAAGGFSVQRADREHISRLKDCISLIRHARRKIELFRTPTDSLFVDFSDGFDTEIRTALARGEASEVLSPIILKLGKDGEPLVRFFREIGGGYTDDALRLCDYSIHIMETRLASAESSFAKRKKLYIALPLLFAVSLIVLIL